MSDRDLTELENWWREWGLSVDTDGPDIVHFAAPVIKEAVDELRSLRAELLAPVEPPVLSRAQMYELIDGRRSVIHYGDFKDTPGAYSYAKAGARMLADAILEPLSQEASE